MHDLKAYFSMSDSLRKHPLSSLNTLQVDSLQSLPPALVLLIAFVNLGRKSYKSWHFLSLVGVISFLRLDSSFSLQEGVFQFGENY